VGRGVDGLGKKAVASDEWLETPAKILEVLRTSCGCIR